MPNVIQSKVNLISIVETAAEVSPSIRLFFPAIHGSLVRLADRACELGDERITKELEFLGLVKRT